MAITADYAKGSSGAPVLDDTGSVVGIVSATNSIYYTPPQKNLQMVIKSCIPVDAIWKLLR
jgi:S1-C subfamily serine protease